MILLLGSGVGDRLGALPLPSIRLDAEELAAKHDPSSDDPVAKRALLESLGELVRAYADESDRLHLRDEASGQQEALRSTFDTIFVPLDSIYRAYQGRLDELSRRVMERDGDLEELYATDEFRSSQAVAANALYYLNWLNYHGARSLRGARRGESLRQAEKGFSHFVGGDVSPELAAESLLGRGLCYIEMSELDLAQRDFEAVIAARVSAEQRMRARVALLEVYYLQGERKPALSYSERLLSEGGLSGEQAALVRFYRFQTLRDGAVDSGPEESERDRAEADALAAELRGAGPQWRSRVDAVLAAETADPAEVLARAETAGERWQAAKLFLSRGDCAGARPILDEMLGARNRESLRYQREARYWSGICRFEASDLEAAEAELTAALSDGEEAPFADDARYFLFKTLEAMMASEDGGDDVAKRYVAAIRGYLAHHDDSTRVAEVRYRLAEYLQTNADYPAAIDEYQKVDTDAEYSLRSRFGTLQCRFELLRAARDPAAREALVSRIGTGLTDYRAAAVVYRNTESRVEPDVQELDAKVELLSAVHASLGGEGGARRALEILAGFSKRYPEYPLLAAQASRMRLASMSKLGLYGRASAEIERSADALKQEARFDLLRAHAASFAERGRMSASPEDAAAASRAALALYALVEEGASRKLDVRERIAVAQLEEKVGALERAEASYRVVLAERPNTLAALRGLARITEGRGDLTAAAGYWATYSGAVRAGDIGWFRGQYEQARLSFAAGDRLATCKRLRALRTALPALADEQLRASLKALFERAGC